MTSTAASSPSPSSSRAAVIRVPPPRPAPPDAPVEPAHVASLSGTVLRTLTREVQSGYSTGLLRTLVLAVISLGFLPIVTWTRQFRSFARFERQQLWHLAEWLRLHTGRSDATALIGVADSAGWRPLPGVAALAVAAATFAVVAATLWREPEVFNVLVSAAVHEGSPATLARQGAAPLVALLVWNGGLSIAYALHWLQVRLHAVAVNRFVAGLNRVLAAERLDPIVPPTLGWGAHPAWLAVGGVGVFGWAIWALPLALAGALHRRYTNVWCPAVRIDAARRVRTMLLAQRPVVDVPSWGGESLACKALRCGAVMPTEARFCPRCGTRVRRHATSRTD